MVMVKGREGNEWGETKQGALGGGNEPDPEEGSIFWPIYFYPLAFLEFLRTRRAAIEEKFLQVE
jgi:hypothetical protein